MANPAPGTKLGNGVYIGTNGEIVFPGLNDPQNGYVYVNGQPVPYKPTTGDTVAEPPRTMPTVAPTTNVGTPAYAAPQTDSLAGQSVSTADLVTRAGITPQGTPTDVAFGSELQQMMFQNILAANADRRASVDQTVSIINLLSELERVSPTRAASFAAALGMGNGPDLGFVNKIGQGAMARVSGRAGNQDISLPLTLSGQDLSFLSSNPNVASVVKDVADAIGLPDIFQRSSAAAIPTSRALAALA